MAASSGPLPSGQKQICTNVQKYVKLASHGPRLFLTLPTIASRRDVSMHIRPKSTARILTLPQAFARLPEDTTPAVLPRTAHEIAVISSVSKAPPAPKPPTFVPKNRFARQTTILTNPPTDWSLQRPVAPPRAFAPPFLVAPPAPPHQSQTP